MTYVLDAWAILSYLQNNVTTVQKLDDLLEQASRGEQNLVISWINVGEVEYILRRRHGAEETEKTLQLLQFLPIEHIPVTEKRIHHAARMKSRGGLSYADAFVVSLAEERKGTILTGDPEILEFPTPIEVHDLS